MKMFSFLVMMKNDLIFKCFFTVKTERLQAPHISSFSSHSFAQLYLIFANIESIIKTEYLKVFLQHLILIIGLFNLQQKLKRSKMLIIPSKQLLLITAQQSKQVFLFDPKTTAVQTKYHTEPSIGKTLTYYPHSNQFITTFNNKTFLNIWSTDCQQPINKVSTIEMISYLLVSKDKNILFAGSINGSLYIWELPSGILIRKTTVHSGQIKKIIEYKSGHLMTCSKNQIKMWNLSSFYIQTQRSTPIKIINFILEVIDVEFARNIFAVLTRGNQSKQFPQINKEDIQFPTKICASLSHFYVGDFQGSIHANEIVTSQNSLQLNFDFNQGNQQLQINKVPKKIVLKGQNKHPITCLIHLKSLPYLISGNTEGDVFVWHNHALKKSVKLFKTSIKFIYSIPKPMEDKIPQNLKIRPFAKYEQNKQTQPLEVNIQKLNFQREGNSSQGFDFDREIDSVRQDISNQLILQRMLEVLNRPEQILKGKISQLEQQRQTLISTALHYAQILSQQQKISKIDFDF